MKKACFVCPLLLFAITAFAQNNYVYTNDNFSPNTVSAFKVSPSNGALTLIPGSPFLTGGNGGARDVSPETITTATLGPKSFVYAANDSSGSISAFVIDPRTGSLTTVPGSPFAAGTPSSNSTLSLAASPNGRFLFEVDESSTFIRTFNIAPNGALTEAAGSPFDSGAFPEGLKVTANGKFLAVGLKTMNAVGVYAIDANGGLKPVFGSPFLTNGAAAAVDSNCASNRVFVASAGSDLVDAFIMAADGSLRPVAGSPFPSGGTSTVNALTLTPSNENLLTSDVFNSAVSSLAVARDGSLRPVPGSPFPATDWVGSIATTRSGKFVYTSLFTRAAVDGWQILDDGSLRPVPGRPFSTGQAGAGVQALTTFPAPSCSVTQ
ncbi:MAG TPA: beta-propeller fold lactonase family protein [Candidatus Angelobacter sp.]|jgi:6-phosphogluconolactonase (cycloisomerase 2 family)|nr:beta-propeller fold lactonase family protein [Candidatus Angelobacter sp.]